MSDPFTGLKICYWNANGIYSKLTDFKNFLHNHNPDVILLQETMLKPTQTIFIPNYNFFRNDGPQNPVSGVSTNWKTFTKQLSQITPLFPSNIDNSIDLETAVDNLTTNIITANNLASKSLHNKSTYFLPLPIQRLITQRNRARKNWQKYRDPFSKHLYNRAQAILRKEIKIYNESTWATELAALNTEDSSLWITAKRFKRNVLASPH
ncbi:RNA-directed DNA polymerase from mobile element jockey [Caerostris extrusa]|uniref:RNA-directed DNA polymerase from mobile element jockey n=1 Tax=Caerostris extrusa TaxID=172846 RepID=A0AAV4MIQ2_CAEEX|nr:RNA-directed DNA polymerase from mobile element jockey [Caerostris extrusa]